MKQDFDKDIEDKSTPKEEKPLLPEVIEPGQINHHASTDLLTESQLKFAHLIYEGKGLSESYEEAFPESKGKTAVRTYAYKLIRSPKVRQEIELLQQAARMQFIMHAPAAAQKLVDLSENAKQERVQLEATKDLLNRAGLQPPQRVESVTIGIFGSASSEDIRALLRKNITNEEEDSSG